MSSKQDLLGFLRKEKESSEKEKVDWARVRDEWAKEISRVVQQVEKWLEPAVSQDLIRIERSSQAVWEEDLGSYEVPLILIKTPSGKEIRLRSVGRIILGARGRIDLVSGSKKAILLRNANDEWVFRNPMERNVPDLPLSEESFADILKQLIE